MSSFHSSSFRSNYFRCLTGLKRVLWGWVALNYLLALSALSVCSSEVSTRVLLYTGLGSLFAAVFVNVIVDRTAKDRHPYVSNELDV